MVDWKPSNFRNLFLVAAVASICSAVTTAVLIWGPGVDMGGDLLSQARLHDNPAYLYKPWVLFFHPQFAFIASLGIGFALFGKRPVCVSIGLFYLLVWALTEMTQQAYVIDALNQFWRPGLLNADGAAEREHYETLLTGFRGITDSQYFLLLFGFGVGSLLLGCALLSADLFGRIIGVILILIGVLSLTAFAGYYTGAAFLTTYSNWAYANLYGVVQTGVRVAMGIWLWQVYRQAGAAAR